MRHRGRTATPSASVASGALQGTHRAPELARLEVVLYLQLPLGVHDLAPRRASTAAARNPACYWARRRRRLCTGQPRAGGQRALPQPQGVPQAPAGMGLPPRHHHRGCHHQGRHRDVYEYDPSPARGGNGWRRTWSLSLGQRPPVPAGCVNRVADGREVSVSGRPGWACAIAGGVRPYTAPELGLGLPFRSRLAQGRSSST